MRGVSPVLPSPDLALDWRPITADDIDIWHLLVRDIEQHEDSSERQDREDLIDDLREGWHKDPLRDSVIGVDGDGIARAFGLVTAFEGNTLRRVFLSGGVHPEWRGRGIGRAVLHWQTERAREVLAEQERRDPGVGELPWRIMIYHRETLDDRTALCRAAGYTAVRWFHEMLRPLGTDAPPIFDVSVPSELVVAPWTEDLDEQVRDAHNEAFAHHWGSQPRGKDMWQRLTVGHRTFRRDWSRVVLDSTEAQSENQSVVAYLASHAYSQDWDAKGYRVGWVDLIGVRPAWRGRRLAAALLAECLQACMASGMDAAGLEVDTGNTSGALDLYTGMGFGIERTTVAFALGSVTLLGSEQAV